MLPESVKEAESMATHTREEEHEEMDLADALIAVMKDVAKVEELALDIEMANHTQASREARMELRQPWRRREWRTIQEKKRMMRRHLPLIWTQ
jgi:hypothetical protein